MIDDDCIVDVLSARKRTGDVVEIELDQNGGSRVSTVAERILCPMIEGIHQTLLPLESFPRSGAFFIKARAETKGCSSRSESRETRRKLTPRDGARVTSSSRQRMNKKVAVRMNGHFVLLSLARL